MMQTMRVASAVFASLSLLAAAPAIAAEPTIPASFHGTWRVADGTCETVHSFGVLVDAREVMFGETGFFVDRVQSNGMEVEIVASQPPESTTQGTIHFSLRLSEDGKVMTLANEEASTTFHRCDTQ
jgi:hypothetical protein